MQTSELKRIAVIFISFCFPQFSAIHLKFQESVLTELVRWLEDVDFNVLLHFQEHLSPWWASLVKKKKRRPVRPEPVDLQSGCLLINQRGKLYIPWSKMEQQRQQKREPPINSKQRQLTVPAGFWLHAIDENRCLWGVWLGCYATAPHKN